MYIAVGVPTHPPISGVTPLVQAASRKPPKPSVLALQTEGVSEYKVGPGLTR